MQTVTLLIAIAIAAAVGEPGTAKFLVAATLATVMGTFIMLAILFRTVRLQTERATEAARRFAAGDLTGRIREDGPTEFAGLAIAQRLERTGDISVSIAGNLIYLVEGRVVRHGNA